MANKTNVTINGKGYFRITKTVGHELNVNGVEVPVRKQFYGINRKDCEKKYQAYMKKANAGISTEKSYFGITADKWIYTFFINDQKLKGTTRDLYVHAWNKYLKPCDFYNLPLDKVTAATIQKAYNGMDAPTSSIRAIHKLMRKFYKYLEYEGIARNFTSALSIPKKERAKDNEEDKQGDIITWTDSEISIIMNNFDKADKRFRFRFLLVLAYNTGLRISELLALTYDDISKNGIEVNKQVSPIPTFNSDGTTSYTLGIEAPKSKNGFRTVPVNADVLSELEKHKAWQNKDMMKHGYRTKYLFTTSEGGYLDRHNVCHAIERYYDRIGIAHKKFHSYRATFATNLCKNGVSIQTACSLLGHESVSTTSKYYVSIDQSEKQKAVDLLSGVINQ
ncbi:MAG: site-specific integrase [Eubacteriaceae bacterium]|jgi:site-specific recombinase XerD|nr:site-specific integrase [Eubacteriaceae bacterium]